MSFIVSAVIDLAHFTVSMGTTVMMTGVQASAPGFRPGRRGEHPGATGLDQHLDPSHRGKTDKHYFGGHSVACERWRSAIEQ